MKICVIVLLTSQNNKTDAGTGTDTDIHTDAALNMDKDSDMDIAWTTLTDNLQKNLQLNMFSLKRYGKLCLKRCCHIQTIKKASFHYDDILKIKINRCSG
jgi:hypothetical protein